MAGHGLDGRAAAFTISSATQRCHHLFTRCLDVPLLMEREWAENRLADFNLWASGIGAAAAETDKISLDARLSGKPTLLTVLTRLLYMLIDFLEECLALAVHQSADEAERHLQWLARSRHHVGSDSNKRSRSPNTRPVPHRRSSRSISPWSDQSSLDLALEDLGGDDKGPLAEAMIGIDTTLEQLNNISFAVRRAGSQLRLQKADSRFTRSDHASLETFLTFWVLATCKRTSPMETMTDNRARLDPLQMRLIEANLIRRNRFLYAQRHSQRLLKSQGAPHAHPFPVTREDLPPYEDARQALFPRQRDPVLGTVAPSGPALEPLADNTTATRLESATEILKETAHARDSQITSTALRVRYPNPPKTLDFGISLGSRWRRHLAEDICPYTCILSGCPKPKTTFVTRRAWMSHMTGERHSTDQFWGCLICADGVRHADKAALSDHIQEKHAEHVSVDQMPTLLDASLQTASTAGLCCPLCPSHEAAETRSSLDHIAEHIHSFALLSLPWAPDAPVVAPHVVTEASSKVIPWLGLKDHPVAGPDLIDPAVAQNSTTDEASLYFQTEAYFAENGSMHSSASSASTDTDRDLEGFDVMGPLVFSEQYWGYNVDFPPIERDISPRLYIGNLAFSTTDKTLHKKFQEFGKVEEAFVVKHRDTVQSRGFGYVRFSTALEAADARLRMNHTELDGRPIQVDYARESTGRGRDLIDSQTHLQTNEAAPSFLQRSHLDRGSESERNSLPTFPARPEGAPVPSRRHRPVSSNDAAVDETASIPPSTTSDVSRSGKRSPEPESHTAPTSQQPLTIQVPEWLNKSITEISSTFEDLEQRQRIRLQHAVQNSDVSPYRVNLSSEAIQRSRYSSEQPWDTSRIRLKKPIEGSDYINASPITLTCEIPGLNAIGNKDAPFPLKRRYIATQGPTEETRFHFWQMVLQETQHSGVIIMLTRHFEGGKEKCSHYFPSDMENPTMILRAPVTRGEGHGGEFKGEVVANDQIAPCKPVSDMDPVGKFQLGVTNVSGDVRLCLATVDTGTPVNVVSREFVESIGFPIDTEGRGTLFTCLDGQKVASQGTVQISFELTEVPLSKEAEFHVVEDLGSHQVLLRTELAEWARLSSDLLWRVIKPGSEQHDWSWETEDEVVLRAEPEQMDTAECTIRLLSTQYEASMRCEVRHLLLKIGAEKRFVHHYLFEEWPESGRPNLTNSLGLVQLQEYLRRVSRGSLRIVHGSAGAGRTGTFIALDFLLELLHTGRLGGVQDNGKDLIEETVDSLREQRMMMVENEVQYAFIYKVLRDQYIKKILH
ncbi:hypothetical protein, variant [Phialophora macrospora]|uniref:RRM domain-containing protein n=1 Tax=Phialophora macrospora TaxID=1851006 RepID=A0A0D2FRE1_9EURO|nr:hypothetical protein, variant [Phialophora macrospora]